MALQSSISWFFFLQICDIGSVVTQLLVHVPVCHVNFKIFRVVIPRIVAPELPWTTPPSQVQLRAISIHFLFLFILNFHANHMFRNISEKPCANEVWSLKDNHVPFLCGCHQHLINISNIKATIPAVHVHVCIAHHTWMSRHHGPLSPRSKQYCFSIILPVRYL